MLSAADLHGGVEAFEPLVHATMQGMVVAAKGDGEASLEYPAVISCLLGYGLDANSCPEGATETAVKLCWELEKELPTGVHTGAALLAAAREAEGRLIGACAYA